jgi:hypothetical protein
MPLASGVSALRIDIYGFSSLSFIISCFLSPKITCFRFLHSLEFALKPLPEQEDKVELDQLAIFCVFWI